MIYLASAYTHESNTVQEERFLAVCKVAAILISRGEMIFSPIAHSHPISHFGLPGTWEFWERYDREMISRCDEMYVLDIPGSRESTGVKAEIAIAHLQFKHVSVVDEKGVVRRGGLCEFMRGK